MHLHDLGWREGDHTASIPLPAGDVIGRVAVEHRNGYGVYTEEGEFSAEISGRFRHSAERDGPAGLPAVGDWVILRPTLAGERATIREVLPRSTQFTRKVAGRDCAPQIIAANVDGVFLVGALNGDFNLRRLERYLTLAWECGAQPVIVLNKADLCDDQAGERARAAAIAPDVPVHVVSAVSGVGVAELAGYFEGCRTMAFLGSSGVGKSTLINRLLGRELQSTEDVREDGKGRHTTTRRELFLRPGAGLVLDTPGMRELQLWAGAEGVETTFAEVEDLASQCRFRDCRHENEPGCAVNDAVRAGALPAERLHSYRKLRGEIRYLEEKQDDRARADRKREEKRLNAALYRRLEQKRRL